MIFLFQGARILRFQPLIFWGVEHDFGIFQSSPLARSVGRWVRRSPSFVSAASQLVVFGRSPFGSGGGRVVSAGERQRYTPCEVKVLRVSWGQVVVGKWIPCLKLTETNLKMGKNPIRKGCRWCSLPLPPIFHGLWLLVNFRECYLKKVLGALPAWADFDRIRITHWKNNFLRSCSPFGEVAVLWLDEFGVFFFITLHSWKVTESHTNHV